METLIPIIAIILICVFVFISINKIATTPEKKIYKPKKVVTENVKKDIPSSPPIVEKTKIIIWGPWDKDKATTLSTSIAKFNSTNRRVNVIYVYKQNLELALSSILGINNNPDIILFDRSYTSLFVKKKYFIPLDQLMETESLLAQDFLPAAIDELTFETTTYGIPLSINTKGLMYNTDIFKEKGISLPPTNWEEVVDYASKLTIRKDDELIRAGIAINDEYIFPSVLASYGGSIFTPDGVPSFNCEASVHILKIWHNLIYKDKSYELGFSDGSDNNFFANGQIAMKFGDVKTMISLEKKHPDLNYGIAPIPAGPFANVIPIITGYGLGIYKNCSNTEFAFDVIKHLTTNQGVIDGMFNVGGLISANIKSHSAPIFSKPVFKEIISYMSNGTYNKDSLKYNKIEREALILNIQLVLSDIVTPEEAMKDAEERALAILNE